jgi:DNA-binding transcriptional ArsR family regulator
MTSGAVCAVIQDEFGISQPAVSQHLKVLRDSGFATVRPEGARRLYAVRCEPLRDVDAWLGRFRRFRAPHLDALATELPRGKRERRLAHRGRDGRSRRAGRRRPHHRRLHRHRVAGIPTSAGPTGRLARGSEHRDADLAWRQKRTTAPRYGVFPAG